MRTASDMSDLDTTRSHDSAGPPLAGDLDSFPSHGELARTLVGAGGVAALSTLAQSGHPYASLAPISTLADGSPVICVSDLAEHTQNLRRDSRCSLLVNEPSAAGVDPLSRARVTLTGTFAPFVPATADLGSHLEMHPFVRRYIGFDDFSWWKLAPVSARYVGGYGFMGWATADEYCAASVDPVIPHALAMIEHLNADHGPACHAIVRHLAGLSAATSAAVIAVDRYGMTFDAFGGPDHTQIAVARVAFAEPLTDPDQVRGASIDLVRRAASVDR